MFIFHSCSLQITLEKKGEDKKKSENKRGKFNNKECHATAEGQRHHQSLAGRPQSHDDTRSNRNGLKELVRNVPQTFAKHSCN